MRRAGFSALQRAEIAEIGVGERRRKRKSRRFSALQRAEIAEIRTSAAAAADARRFQCSSTSRNC